MAIRPLIGFGIGFLAGGLYWALYQDVITRYFAKYVLSTTDKYYLASNLIWNAIPYLIIFLGVVCLIMSGLSRNKEVSE
jgi:uncharacterized membrane protein